jgi:hypothetical protein
LRDNWVREPIPIEELVELPIDVMAKIFINLLDNFNKDDPQPTTNTYEYYKNVIKTVLLTVNTSKDIFQTVKATLEAEIKGVVQSNRTSQEESKILETKIKEFYDTCKQLQCNKAATPSMKFESLKSLQADIINITLKNHKQPSINIDDEFQAKYVSLRNILSECILRPQLTNITTLKNAILSFQTSEPKKQLSNAARHFYVYTLGTEVVTLLRRLIHALVRVNLPVNNATDLVLYNDTTQHFITVTTTPVPSQSPVVQFAIDVKESRLVNGNLQIQSYAQQHVPNYFFTELTTDEALKIRRMAEDVGTTLALFLLSKIDVSKIGEYKILLVGTEEIKNYYKKPMSGSEAAQFFTGVSNNFVKAWGTIWAPLWKRHQEKLKKKHLPMIDQLTGEYVNMLFDKANYLGRGGKNNTNKILNPKTGRYVNRNGKIGTKIIASKMRSKKPKEKTK